MKIPLAKPVFDDEMKDVALDALGSGGWFWRRCFQATTLLRIIWAV